MQQQQKATNLMHEVSEERTKKGKLFFIRQKSKLILMNCVSTFVVAAILWQLRVKSGNEKAEIAIYSIRKLLSNSHFMD